ncbi:hypothetical protein [Staphylococcus lutrae]|nr:hypothetical protein [Staphylococcus lutrae]
MTWALNCDVHHTVAHQLYQRLGFRVCLQKERYGHRYHYMTYRNGEKIHA